MNIPSLKTSFLIVQKWDGYESQIGIKELFSDCFKENQHYELLLFTDVKRPKENFEVTSRVHVISKSDLTLIGKIKSKKLLPSEHTHFDAVLLLDELTKKQGKIIKSLKIEKTVGFCYEREYVNINLITTHTKPIEKVIFAVQTLSKFSN